MWRFLPVVGPGCFTGLVTPDPSPPDTGSWPPPAGGHVGASTEERNWAMAAHLGSRDLRHLLLGLRDHRDGPRLERCGLPVPIDAPPRVLSPRYDTGQPTR